MTINIALSLLAFGWSAQNLEFLVHYSTILAFGRQREEISVSSRIASAIERERTTTKIINSLRSGTFVMFCKMCFLFFFFWLAGRQNPSMQPWNSVEQTGLNVQRSSWLCILSAGIKSEQHQTWISLTFWHSIPQNKWRLNGFNVMGHFLKSFTGHLTYAVRRHMLWEATACCLLLCILCFPVCGNWSAVYRRS